MSNKKRAFDDANFDPSIPEDGVALTDDESQVRDLYSSHLPSAADIAVTAREAFGDKLPEDMLQNLMHCSTEINESVRRIMHAHMELGFQFGAILRTIHTAYIGAFGDSKQTQKRATDDMYAYIEKLHRISGAKIRLHLKAYARFNDNSDAVEFLRLTDMQYLVGTDISDDIVEEIIARKKDDPEMSTRTVRELISILRQQKDHITADKEQLDSVNAEYAGLLEQFNSASSEANRLRQEIEQLRAQQADAQESTDRLRNELALSSQSSSALHQQLHDTQQALATARRELNDANARPPAKEDPVVKEEIRRLEVQYDELYAKSKSLREDIEQKEQRHAEIVAQLAEDAAALEAARRLDEEMNALVKDFSAFAQRYNSAQLLCTADGNPARFRAVFQALGDLVGKFHVEINAALKKAA
jgi:predicted  nucleic acid-binding Zn-ribbon protein